MENESEKQLLSASENIDKIKDEKDVENAENSLLQVDEELNGKSDEKTKILSKSKFMNFFKKNSAKTAELENEEEKNQTKIDSTPSKSTKYFPQLSGFLDRFRKGKYDVSDNGIELGNSEPKAGLASMETLETDSTKDPWTVDGTEPVTKTAEESKTNQDVTDQCNNARIWDSIKNYDCTFDDMALIGGILIFLILVGLIIIFTFVGNSKQPYSAPIRDGKVLAVTSCGLVEGLVENSAIAFRGIPYAMQPIGNLRFTPAQPIDNLENCWNGTFIAHNSTPSCLQLDSADGNITGVEDCLTLDVITPEVRYINLLPVIVMIGSDSFVHGSPGLLRPSTKYARSKSVVFVRPNFRLNIFGFLALDSISNSSNIPSSGNYALSDIIAALEWVNLNIHNFGGDKDSVTIFGHRVGATLSMALTASPRASKLFTQVWASSGSEHFPGNSLKLGDFERKNAEYGNLFPECKKISDWQNIESSTLLNKIPESWKAGHSHTLPSQNESSSDFHDWIVLDGIFLKKHPEDFWKTNFKALPKIVIGTTAHAAYSKDSFLSKNLTEEEIVKYISESKIGSLNLTDEVLKRYGKTKQGLISMISDIRIICPLLVQARSQSNIVFYVVTQTQGEDQVADVDSDIQAILGRYSTTSPEKRRYHETMLHLFYYFVYNRKVYQYNSQNTILDIQQDITPKSNYSHCDFWIANQFVPNFAAYF